VKGEEEIPEALGQIARWVETLGRGADWVDLVDGFRFGGGWRHSKLPAMYLLISSVFNIMNINSKYGPIVRQLQGLVKPVVQ
jgi:hypothetical protein